MGYITGLLAQKLGNNFDIHSIDPSTDAVLPYFDGEIINKVGKYFIKTETHRDTILNLLGKEQINISKNLLEKHPIGKAPSTLNTSRSRAPSLILMAFPGACNS